MMKINIRKGEYGYYTKVKNIQNDEEIIAYMNVQFPKDKEPAETALQINIKDMFLSCYNSQEGTKVKLVVTDYEVLRIYDDSQNTQESEVSQTNEHENFQIDLDLSDELPFE